MFVDFPNKFNTNIVNILFHHPDRLLILRANKDVLDRAVVSQLSHIALDRFHRLLVIEVSINVPRTVVSRYDKSGVELIEPVDYLGADALAWG